MSIANINNGETGLSARDKINQSIDIVNLGVVTGATLNVSTLEFNTNNTTDAFHVDLSTLSTVDNFTTGATLSNGVISFDRNDTLNAYSVDINSALDDYLPITGGTITGNLGVNNNLTVSLGDVQVTVGDVNVINGNVDSNEVFTTSLRANSTGTISGSLFSDATTSPNTKTIGIGTGGVAGSNTLISLGSSLSNSQIDIQGNLDVTSNLDIGGDVLFNSDANFNGDLFLLALTSGSTSDEVLTFNTSNSKVERKTIILPNDKFTTGGTYNSVTEEIDFFGNSPETTFSVDVSGLTPFNVGCFGITIDGAGSAITTGVKGTLIVPYDCTIDCWAIVGDQSGSTVVDVWKGSSPLTIPTSASDSIAGTEKPTLSSQQINTDLTLTSWTTSLVFGDVLVFNVDSASTVTRVTIQIKVIKI